MSEFNACTQCSYVGNRKSDTCPCCGSLVSPVEVNIVPNTDEPFYECVDCNRPITRGRVLKGHNQCSECENR